MMPLFGFLAGVLSILSPCVLPLVPIVLGAAASEHRFGPLALAAGLTLSFTVIGLFVATVGFAIGIDGDLFRSVSAVLLIAIGLVLALPVAQVRFATAAGPVGNWVENRFGGFSTRGVGGQFGLGILLGGVWSPCVGPTLGAASVMAAGGQNLAVVAATMLAFGLGAGLPLAVLGTLSRETLVPVLGLVLVVAGGMILAGLGKALEAFLVEASPEWLTRLTTAI